MRPYMGVTGIMTEAESFQLLRHIPKSSTHDLMLGILASSKTLNGETNKYPNRFPKVEDIAEISVPCGQIMTLIHYSTDSEFMLSSQLRHLREYFGDWVEGFQLNISWPTPSYIERYKEAYPGDKLVLQVGKKAMSEIMESVDQLVERVGWYVPFIDYVLLDPSGGRGELFDTQQARILLRALSSLPVGLGVAGGLSPDTLNLVEPLLDEFPELSIDAEGRLRDSNDKLDLQVACSYLDKAYEMFARKSK